MALIALLDAYVESLHSRAKPGSIKTARAHVRTLLNHFGTCFDPQELRLRDIEDFTAERLKTVSRASVNGALGVLRSALRWGVEADLLPSLPVRVRKLREGKRLPTVLTPPQVTHLLSEARPSVRIMLLLAARAGLRHGEILHLQIRDVDLSRRVVRVSAKPGWCPKSHHEREVPLSPDTCEQLTPFLNAKEPTDYLFAGSGGAPQAEACAEVRRVFQTAGLYDPAGKPGLHCLRRTWATELLGRGADIETVRQLGGWSSLAVVQRYVTSSDERKRNAIASLEES